MQQAQPRRHTVWYALSAAVMVLVGLLYGADRLIIASEESHTGLEQQYLTALQRGQYGAAYDLLCGDKGSRAAFVAAGREDERRHRAFAGYSFAFQRAEGGVEVSHFHATWQDGLQGDVLLWRDFTRRCVWTLPGSPAAPGDPQHIEALPRGLRHTEHG